MPVPSAEPPSSGSITPTESSALRATFRSILSRSGYWRSPKPRSSRPSSEVPADLLRELAQLNRSIEHLVSSFDRQIEAEAEFRGWLRDKIQVWIVQLSSGRR